MARPRVSENVHAGGGDGAKQPFGLIAIRIEEPVDGSDHALDLESFATWNIEGSILEDLDLEPLKDSVLLAETLVPTFDAFSLQSETLRIEPRGNLEAA